MDVNKDLSPRRKIDRLVILAFTVAVITTVSWVLLMLYRPDQNRLAALASVCLDTISMVVTLILVNSHVFQKGEYTKTTRLYLCLMLGTLFALLFDFLVWSFDGSLSFDDFTFVFIITSLGMGAVLGATFIAYLNNYLWEMHDIKLPRVLYTALLTSNLVAYVLTITLGFTRNAFIIVDGHYQTGPSYDYITVIPVLTLLIVTGFCIKNVKTIGINDVVAVVGYILLMIIGALVEATYSIGTTYVAVAVAGVFIFVMLQSKFINRVRQQKEILTEQITKQYGILESMAGIYSYVNYLDLKEESAKRFDEPSSIIEAFDLKNNPHTSLNYKIREGIDKDQREKYWTFTDLSTLSKRMTGEKLISADFHHEDEGWFRAHFIRIGDLVSQPVQTVIYAVRNIDEEKKNVEMWIEKSNTDELTGFLNRHAYEDDIAVLSESKIKDNLVYVSIDVNSLKVVNDMLGHEAGDELIVGACECMRQCFGAYGKLYRTGGDEFAALIYADEKQLSEIMKDIDEVTENWRGKLNETVAISCGYVSRKENPSLSIHEMAVLADKRMYEDKTRYYQKQGIDRRGQRDAHVALCDLYTKILKINLTDNSYQIVNEDSEEKTEEKGFSDILSDWLNEFAASGRVHPEDLQDFIDKVNIENLSRYFKNNKKVFRTFYRRQSVNGYRKVMLEIIPANDYSDNSQSLFLYVKEIDE